MYLLFYEYIFTVYVNNWQHSKDSDDNYFFIQISYDDSNGFRIVFSKREL